MLGFGRTGLVLGGGKGGFGVKMVKAGFLALDMCGFGVNRRLSVANCPVFALKRVVLPQKVCFCPEKWCFALERVILALKCVGFALKSVVLP